MCIIELFRIILTDEKENTLKKLTKETKIKYGCALLFSAVIVLITLAKNDFLKGLPAVDVFRILSDAFLVPGILLLMAGILMWISKEGALDSLSWGARKFTGALGPKKDEKEETFLEYVEKRREERTKGFGFLLITGTLMLLISLLFLFLFFKVGG